MMATSEAVAFVDPRAGTAADPPVPGHPPPPPPVLILLAVVEWDDHDSQQRQRRKVPIRSDDVCRPPAVAGAELEVAVLRRLGLLRGDRAGGGLPSKILQDEKEDNGVAPTEERTLTAAAAAMLRIYDPRHHDYVTVDPSLPDVVASFGKRVRLLLGPMPPSLTEQQSQTQQQTQPTGGPGPWLALPGKHFANDFVDGRLEIAGVSLRVHQESSPSRTGGTVWDGAVLLARFLERRPELVRSKAVLELGAGCGLVGITAAALGARRVCLTDLAYCLERMERNVLENWPLLERCGGGCDGIECSVCDWNDPPPDLWAYSLDDGDASSGDSSSGAFDVILAADCVWMEELVEPLLNLLDRVTRRDDAVVVLSYQRRGKATDVAFWTGLRRRFRVEVLPNEPRQPPVLQLLSCRRL